MKKKIIGIKLGSATLVENGIINKKFIRHVCSQVAKLIRSGFAVFIVTSGAVASGYKEGRSKNLNSAIGQSKLTHIYSKYFADFGIEVSQHLFTDREFMKKDNVVTRNILLEALVDGVVPIINANDSVDSYELQKVYKCADNDRLLMLVSELVGADMVIIGFTESGFKNNDGRVIHCVRSSEISKYLGFAKGGSVLGHGKNGMKTKILMLSELANKGTSSILVPTKERDFILRAVSGEKDFGTAFHT